MKSDRELLELAAKSVGVVLEYRSSGDAFYYDDAETGREEWRPDQYYRQCFILANEHSLIIDFDNCRAIESVDFFHGHKNWTYSDDEDLDGECKTLRAVLILSAAIGEKME